MKLIIPFLSIFSRACHGFFPTSHHGTMFRRSTSNAAYSGIPFSVIFGAVYFFSFQLNNNQTETPSKTSFGNNVAS